MSSAPVTPGQVEQQHRQRRAGAAATGACLAALACGACNGSLDSSRSAQQAGPDLGRGAAGSDAAAVRPGGDDGSVDPGASNDMNCGGMLFAATRVAPNVMLVLDRSNSMHRPIAPNSPTSKWQDLATAMNGVLMQYDGQLRFGLDLFPEADQVAKMCFPGQIAVRCGPGNGAQVAAAIAATKLYAGTPTATTLDVVIASGVVADPARDNYVVLATDGLPNCGDVDVTARIGALYSGKPAVRTYVVGVGGDTASNPTLLNAWAVAGHTDRPGPTKYYQANSPQDLQDAFNAIAAGVVSCVFKLSQIPPDPMQLYVWENGQMVKVDPVDGYTYDAIGPSLTLHGMACGQFKNDPSTRLQVVYGCPSPPPIM